MLVSKFLTKNKTGMTIVELTMAVAIILIVVIPLTRVLFRSMKGAMSFGDANRAVQLAQDLMEEIKQKKWDENEPAGGGQTPTGSYSVIGTDLGETAGDKTTYDDIDDYNGLVENPPKDIANNDIPNPGFPDKFIRRVVVKYVTIPDTNPATIVPLGIGTTHYKAIIVTVDWQGEGKVGGVPVTVSTVRANVKRY